MADDKAEITKEEVVRRLHLAYNALLKQDNTLLLIDANERSITHKLAEHLQAKFPRWNVDCEYNRDREDSKRLPLSDEINVVNVLTNNTDGRTVFPDIVVHRRGTDANLLVIEAKKSTTLNTGNDEKKLKQLKDRYSYRFAFFVVFPMEEAASNASASKDIREVL